MFHWICPECGREIAPSVRECPSCDPVAKDLSSHNYPGRHLSEGERRLITEVAPPTMAGPLPAGPILPRLTRSAHHGPTLEPFPALTGAIEGATNNNVESHSAEFTASSPWPAEEPPVENAASDIIDIQPEWIETENAPLPSAELAPPNVAVNPEKESDQEAPLGKKRARFAAKTNAPSMPPILRNMVTESQLALEAGRAPTGLLAAATVQTEALPPVASVLYKLNFAAKPSASVPCMWSPASPFASLPVSLPLVEVPGYLLRVVLRVTAAPSIAPWVRYSPLAQRPIRPIAPERVVIHLDSAPRRFASSPALTGNLLRFSDPELRLMVRSQPIVSKRMLRPGILVTLIVGTIAGAGFSDLVLNPTRPPARAEASASSVQASIAAETLTPELATPLAKGVEVTGFRVQMEPGKKQEIQYLVINHTSASLKDIKVYVTLYSASAKVNQAPLCQFAFLAPPLAPYESKEMASSIEGVNRSFTLPDWHDLRSSVEVGQ